MGELINKWGGSGRYGLMSAVTGLAGFFSLIFLWSSWYTVDQGERGVILRTGAVIGTADPGLHFKLPMFDTIRYLSVQSRKVEYPKMQSYSRD